VKESVTQTVTYCGDLLPFTLDRKAEIIKVEIVEIVVERIFNLLSDLKEAEI
jgi:hypothetical protein